MGLRELMKIEPPVGESPEQVRSLEYLQRIYRDPAQPPSVRMRAAIESLPYENPKLSAMAIVNGEEFAVKLDRAIARTEKERRLKLIEGRVIDPDPERN